MSSESGSHVIKLSSRGRITIPNPLRRRLGLRKDDPLRLYRVGRRLVLEPDAASPAGPEAELRDWERLAEASLAEVWDNPADEAWAAELAAAAEPV